VPDAYDVSMFTDQSLVAVEVSVLGAHRECCSASDRISLTPESNVGTEFFSLFQDLENKRIAYEASLGAFAAACAEHWGRHFPSGAPGEVWR